jgi:hypothetical protein
MDLTFIFFLSPILPVFFFFNLREKKFKFKFLIFKKNFFFLIFYYFLIFSSPKNRYGLPVIVLVPIIQFIVYILDKNIDFLKCVLLFLYIELTLNKIFYSTNFFHYEFGWYLVMLVMIKLLLTLIITIYYISIIAKYTIFPKLKMYLTKITNRE